MKPIEKIVFFLLPLSVLFSSLTLIPNRVLVISLLLITLIRNNFFLKGLSKKKWLLFIGILYVLLILFGNPYLSKEAILFLTLPIYLIIYGQGSLSKILQKKYFILAVFCYSIILLFLKSIKIISFGLSNFIKEEQWWNQILYKNISQDLDGHPTYISMFIISSVVMLLHQNEFGKAYFSKSQYGVIQVTLLFVLFLLAVKISFVVGLLILLTYLGFQLKRKNIKTAGLAILFLLISSIITYNMPGIKQRMLSDVQSLQTSSTKDKTENRLKERMALWNASLIFMQNNPLIGTSFQGISSKSGIYSKAKAIYPPLEYPKNCHNNFLEFGVRYGLLGMGIFLFLIILFWIEGIKQASFEIIGILILICFFSLTESFMFREQGISLVAILMSIFGTQFYGKNI